MKIYNELESLGFFEWLSETHNLKDTDMTPEHLDKLPLNDIHRTVCDSMAFRWFREKYQIDSWIYPNLNGLYSVSNVRRGIGLGKVSEYQTYEEAELECLKQLINIVYKQKSK